MTKNITSRDFQRNYSKHTHKLSEPVTVTNRGNPQFTITPGGTSYNSSMVNVVSTLGTLADHLCQDSCIKCNPKNVFEYLKKEVK